MARKNLPEPQDKRTMLLKIAMDMDLPVSRLAQLTAPMRGLPDEEKEKIAETAINQLLSQKD